MSEAKIRTTDELEHHRKRMMNRSTPIGCSIMLMFGIVSILIFVLPDRYPASTMPSFVRPFWDTFPLLVIFTILGMAIVSAIFRLFGSEKYAIPEKAIQTFDFAKKQYERWQRKRDKESLLKSHEVLPSCDAILGELQEYKSLREVVDRDYDEVFGVKSK